MRKNRKLALAGSWLWILGLILTVVGLNVTGDAGTWMTAVGGIIFLAGLMTEGVLWMQQRREDEQQRNAGELPEEGQVPDSAEQK